VEFDKRNRGKVDKRDEPVTDWYSNHGLLEYQLYACINTTQQRIPNENIRMGRVKQADL
jgi:hypothetical protein